MRYEAKHSYFKRLAQITRNFKNVAKTLAFHHQQYMCYHMSNSYLKRILDYKNGKFSSSLNRAIYFCGTYYIAKKQPIQSLDFKDQILAMSSGMCVDTMVYRLVATVV